MSRTKLQLTSRRRLQSPEAKPVRGEVGPGCGAPRHRCRPDAVLGSGGPVAGHTPSLPLLLLLRKKENPLDDPAKMFAAEASGGAGGTRRSQAFKSQDPRVVLFLMTLHDAVLKPNSSGG